MDTVQPIDRISLIERILLAILSGLNIFQHPDPGTVTAHEQLKAAEPVIADAIAAKNEAPKNG